MSIKHIRSDVLSWPDFSAASATSDQVAARHDLPVEHIVKLDSNENLYGPSPRVQEALAASPDWNLYPDGSHQALNQALAGYAGVEPEQIVATNGCDELLLLLALLLVRPGDQVIDAPPTFGVYQTVVEWQGGTVVRAPRRREQGYALDTAAILGAVNGHTRLIFVCNPNNPSGGPTPQKDIEALLETGITVAVDETYHEFAGTSVLPLLARYENLFILRSLSKWAALAGLRVGYGIFQAETARHIRKLRMPFNVNRAGYLAAVASIEDKDYLLANVARIVAERERMLARLQTVPFLHCYPSCGNFILCDVQGVSACVLHDEMEHDGVLVRVYQSPYLANAIRISVGKPEHTEAALAALHHAGQRLKLV